MKELRYIFGTAYEREYICLSLAEVAAKHKKSRYIEERMSRKCCGREEEYNRDWYRAAIYEVATGSLAPGDDLLNLHTLSCIV